jgi:hypothetical protein
MDRHRVEVTVLDDHRIEIRLPDEFPVGLAEVTVLTKSEEEQARSEARVQNLAALEELKQLRISKEEQAVLDEFEAFRQETPFSLASLVELEK